MRWSTGSSSAWRCAGEWNVLPEKCLSTRDSNWKRRSTLSVCSAYCVMTLGLLLLFLAELLQAASGLGLDTSVVYRTRTMTMPESNVTELYASTQRLDWVQAVSGGSGWMRKVCCLLFFLTIIWCFTEFVCMFYRTTTRLPLQTLLPCPS